MSGLSGFSYFHLCLVVEQTLSINIASYTFPLPPGGLLSIQNGRANLKQRLALF
jgi:hypothetical protein